MENSSDISLLYVAQTYSICSDFAIVGFGLIGNFLNIFVLTNLKIFHLNRCAFYLIMESAANMVQLSQILINEIWKMSANRADPTNLSSTWCKLRGSTQQWSRMMLSFILSFAAIDQFLTTNPVNHLRQMASFKSTRTQILFAVLFSLLHATSYGIFLNNQLSSGCGITNTILVNYYTFFYYPYLNGLFPILVSSVFSILAYRNVRRIVRRQIPLERRRLDQQLTAMIFVRVAVYVLLALPYTIDRIYLIKALPTQMDSKTYNINQLVSQIVLSIVYMNHAINFYIFIGTSGRYRRQVKYYLTKKFCQSLRGCCGERNLAVGPLDATLAGSIITSE